MAKTSDAQMRAVAKYNAENTKQYAFRLNITTDKDVIEKLDHLTNKAGYIKELIRADINNKEG